MEQDILLQELNTVKAQVEQCRKENSLVIPLFTDLHTSGLTAWQTETLLPALQLICGHICPDAVIDLGDNLNMLGRMQHITTENLTALLTGLFDAFKAACGCPLLLVHGNHDGIGTDFFNSQWWNGFTKGKYDDNLAHYGTEGSYYYVDYPAAKLRMVFLSLPHGSDLALEHPTPLWSFGGEQLRWLRDEALNTDFAVVLFTHVPFCYDYQDEENAIILAWDGEKTVESYTRNLCGWIEDLEKAVAIIEESGKVLACFSGHTHEDFLYAPRKNGNPLPVPQVSTTLAASHDHKEGDMGICIDILIFTPDEKEIHIVRFGDGESRVVAL